MLPPELGLADLAKWIALRESDRDALRVIAGWENDERRYRVDPLPDKMALASIRTWPVFSRL